MGVVGKGWLVINFSIALIKDPKSMMPERDSFLTIETLEWREG